MKYDGTIGTNYRGSVDGITGSRNASGAYFKRKVKATNPKSLAQIAARSAFRSAGKVFSTLSEAVRAQWESFRKTAYNPFNGKNSQQYTAAQACTAIMASIGNFNRLRSVPVVQGFGEIAPISGITTLDIPSTGDAPLLSVSPNIADATGTTADYEIVGIYATTWAALTMDLRFKGLSGAGLGQGDFIDGQALPYGFQIFISSPVSNKGITPKSEMANAVASSGMITFATDDLTGFTGFRLQLNASAAIARMKEQPIDDQWFKVTITITDDKGTQSKIGAAYAQLGAATPTIPAA
jgi:hypothetical protein